MIVSFSMKNYKSYPERKTRSNDKESDEDVFEFLSGNSRKKAEHVNDKSLLKITAIFGANGSGKSNFITGLKTLKKIMTSNYCSFKYPLYTWGAKSKTTTFEIVFAIGDDVYRHKVEVESVGVADNYPENQLFFCAVKSESLDVANREAYYAYGKKSWNSIINYRNYFGSLQDIIDNQKKIIESLRDAKGGQNKNLESLQDIIDNLKQNLESPQNAEDEQNKKAMCLSILELHKNLIENDALRNEIISKKWREKKLKASNNLEQKEKELDIILAQINEIEGRKREIEIELEDPETTEERRKELEVELDDLDTIQSEKEKIREKIEKDKKLLKKGETKYKGKIENILETIETNRFNIKKKEEELMRLRSLFYRYIYDPNIVYNEDNPQHRKYIQNVLNWYSSTLVVLETYDYIPPLNQPDYLNSLSAIIESLDLGIDNFDWKPVEESSVDAAMDYIDEDDYRRLEKCKEDSVKNSSLISITLKNRNEYLLFTYCIGERRVYSLEVNTRRKARSLGTPSESDGTLRTIELATILLPTKTDRVFIVDELNRRLHPLLTLRLVKLFLEEKTNNKQMIFTTHETHLMTTDILRRDEIVVVDKIDGVSYHSTLDEIQRMNNDTRIDIQYLEGQLFKGFHILGDKEASGIPNIKGKGQF